MGRPRLRRRRQGRRRRGVGRRRAAGAGGARGGGRALRACEAAARAPLDAELLQATFHELALLLGAKLVDGAAETSHLGAAAACLKLAAAAGAARRATLLELPALAAAPFDGGAAPPEPLSLACAEATALAAARPHASEVAEKAADSKQLLCLLPTMLRGRELPSSDDGDAAERALLLLQGFLKASCKPYADAAAPPPLPPLAELVAEIDGGLAVVQWYDPGARFAESGDGALTLLYVLHAPTDDAADGFVVGERSVGREKLREASALLAALEYRQASPAAKNVVGEAAQTVREQFDGCLAKVRALFGGGEGGEEEEEADAALSEECLPQLRAAFDTTHGGGVSTHEGLSKWLAGVFAPGV